jgi:hypothetical protein
MRKKIPVRTVQKSNLKIVEIEKKLNGNRTKAPRTKSPP